MHTVSTNIQSMSYALKKIFQSITGGNMQPCPPIPLV